LTRSQSLLHQVNPSNKTILIALQRSDGSSSQSLLHQVNPSNEQRSYTKGEEEGEVAIPSSSGQSFQRGHTLRNIVAPRWSQSLLHQVNPSNEKELESLRKQITVAIPSSSGQSFQRHLD